MRSRDHIADLLHLDDESAVQEQIINNNADVILKDLKRIYENAIKPLETLYKYRDLSNRHFGDAEIFSKPLVLFMGPWSGGKSTLINYLTGNEHTEDSLRTGAEPSPAYFNILMHGDKPEVLDGTQLAADWTFSGLQKFGQGLEDRLRGLKLPNKLLEKVNWRSLSLYCSCFLSPVPASFPKIIPVPFNCYVNNKLRREISAKTENDLNLAVTSRL